MKNRVTFFAAVLLVFSAAARAAEVNFDNPKANGALDLMQEAADLKGPHQPSNGPQQAPKPPKPPQPGHPGHPGWNPNMPPPPPPPTQYNFGGYRDSCRTFTFTAQSPLTLNEEMILEEYGQECQNFGQGFTGPCRPASRYHRRKVTVEVGRRQLESWETERLELCMKGPKRIDANIDGMLYDYAVAVRNDDGIFKRSTVFTLTPGAKKPARPDSKELAIGFTGVTAAGDVRMVLADSRAEYFRDGTITITADCLRLPEITQNMPVEDLLDGFTKYNVTQTFAVAGTYELKLSDTPKPGKYVVTVKFSRSGPLSSGAEATIIGSFEIR